METDFQSRDSRRARGSTIPAQAGRDPDTAVADYLAKYVHAPATFEDYLDLFGGERLKRAQDAARELVPGVSSAHA